MENVNSEARAAILVILRIAVQKIAHIILKIGFINMTNAKRTAIPLPPLNCKKIEKTWPAKIINAISMVLISGNNLPQMNNGINVFKTSDKIVKNAKIFD